MWVIAVGVVGALLVLLIRAFNNQAEILRDWENALAPWGLESYRELELRLDGEARMTEFAFRRAFEARTAGSAEEAIRMLEAAVEIVERTSPDMIKLLRQMSNAARMAAAISRVDPLPARGFRLRSLSTLALMAAVVHPMLFTRTGRFRFRSYVLQRGIGVATRFLLEDARRLRMQDAACEDEWNRIAAVRVDLQTLMGQSLQTFRILVTSLAADTR
jgi:hypothetical protein